MSNTYKINGKKILRSGANIINCDSYTSFKDLSKDIQYNVCVISAATHGLGDLAFGIKFVELLLRRFPQIEVSFMISNNSRHIELVNSKLKIYDTRQTDGTYIEGSSPNGRVALYLMEYDDNDESISAYFDRYIVPTDIVFIAPATGVRNFIINFAKDMVKNTYIISEYNPTPDYDQSKRHRLKI